MPIIELFTECPSFFMLQSVRSVLLFLFAPYNFIKLGSFLKDLHFVTSPLFLLPVWCNQVASDLLRTATAIPQGVGQG